MEPIASSARSTTSADEDETFFRLLLDFTEPEEDFAELLEETILTLLSDFDEISPSFELFAEVDESPPHAIKNSEHKKESHKVFFITVNITFPLQNTRRRSRHWGREDRAKMLVTSPLNNELKTRCP